MFFFVNFAEYVVIRKLQKENQYRLMYCFGVGVRLTFPYEVNLTLFRPEILVVSIQTKGI